MNDERNMVAPGKVSIWIGEFDDEMEALDYVESDDGFGAQFGCVLCHSRELAVREEAMPLRKLLEGFSSWKDFIDEATSSDLSQRARCAVVAYACDYRLLGITPGPGPMRFLGVASF